MRRHVFITGGTGYMGRALIPELLTRGHSIRALVRPGSEGRLPSGCERVLGNALDGRTFAEAMAPGDTLVHLIGTPHPSPAKARQFREIDLVSVREVLGPAVRAGVARVVFVSVAHPAPIMRAYIAARSEAEDMIRATGLAATILRPWYVLGPGHRWPHLLQPAYWLLERLPATRDGALRLGLVTLPQMIRALVAAVESEPDGFRIVTVPEIREAAYFRRSGSLRSDGPSYR